MTKSRRAFLIGNGPSLRNTPLDLLLDEVTFAMNKIHLIYPQTDWRPSYYLFFEAYGDGDPRKLDEDPNVGDWMNYVIPYHVEDGERCLIRDGYQEAISRKTNGKYLDNVRWVPGTCEHLGQDINGAYVPRAWHLPTICKYGGTMNVALHIAFMMGYDPVYLVGCDLGFKPIPPGAKADPNHFHPRYWTWDDHPLEDRDATLVQMHKVARRQYEGMGRKIYNATMGGELEVYERVDLMEVLNGQS